MLYALEMTFLLKSEKIVLNVLRGDPPFRTKSQKNIFAGASLRPAFLVLVLDNSNHYFKTDSPLKLVKSETGSTFVGISLVCYILLLERLMSVGLIATDN